MQLKPIKYKKAYDDIIAKEIVRWQLKNIYAPINKILKEDFVVNDLNILVQAINTGLIYYQDGAFYSTRNRFSNAISLELEKLGAKYSKYRKAYLINPKKVPIELLGSIDMMAARTAGKVLAIQKFIDVFVSNFDLLEKELVFETAVEQIMFDLQLRFKKNMAEHKITTISPELTDFRANKIAQNYTNNLKFWIKKWQPEHMIKMREVVGQMAIDGKSIKTIAEYIQKEFKIDQNKAIFLARNESAIATTSYLQAKYQEEGFTHYKWITNIDGRERKLHREHNGKIFRFDQPPIIDERTQQRGNPAETYNCRCLMAPYFDKDFIERRKITRVNNGGKGSGNFGHKGRPGKIGGSQKTESWYDESVLKENGQPLIVYRGLRQDYNGFVERNEEEIVNGIFFSDSIDSAKTYERKGGIALAHIKMKNPLVIELDTSYSNFKVREITHYIIKEAKKHNKDGVIIKNIRDYGSKFVKGVDITKPMTDYIVFKPEQINIVNINK